MRIVNSLIVASAIVGLAGPAMAMKEPPAGGGSSSGGGATPVSEPGSFAMMGLGLGAYGAMVVARRRKKARRTDAE